MKKALICLEQLGIGGVETFAITQIKEFARRKIKCYVLAQDGILAEKIRKLPEVEIIDFAYKLENKMDFSKIEEIKNIIKTNKIDFIYVHQYPCIPYVLPAAIKCKVPYIAYLHNIIPGVPQWFMNTFEIYKILLPMFFLNATKIISIAEKVKKENQELFNIPDDKYLIIKNSLDFNEYPDIKIKKFPKKIKNFLLFGRMSEEKNKSINTSINYYLWCLENYNKDIKLTIVGDGDILDDLKEKYKDFNVEFKGALANVKPEIAKADVVLAVDRCALESVASKKPTIICGYSNKVKLVTPDIIKQAVDENFSGYSLEDNKEEIFKYSSEQIDKIIEENYQYVRKELSISNSIYLDIDSYSPHVDVTGIFKNINEMMLKIDKLKDYNYGLNEEVKYLKEQLDFIKSSKRWQLINKYCDILGKLRKK